MTDTEKNLKAIAEFGEAQNAISDIVGWHYKYDTAFYRGVWGIGFNVPAHATEWHPLVRGGAQAEQEIIALNATMDNQAAEIGRLKAELEAALKDRVAPAVQVEPVAWMHEGEGRFDVCHSVIRNLLCEAGLERQVEHYTIPLYDAPQEASPNAPAKPVAWMGTSGVGEVIVSKAQIFSFMTTPLYATPQQPC